MKRSTPELLMIGSALVLVAAGLRVYFQEIPNFAPIAAMALFAGYLFPQRRHAVLVPIGAMMLSDLAVGQFNAYHPVLMAAVYGSLAMPIAFGGWLRPRLQLGATGIGRQAAMGASLVGCAVLASVAFFVVTNFATWCVTPWYDRTWAGLLQCYVNAVPFFRYTLIGDLGFALLLFGGYSTVTLLARFRGLSTSQPRSSAIS